jgi:SAM-dependent methyltransferase
MGDETIRGGARETCSRVGGKSLNDSDMNIQEAVYNDDVDYRLGSPHLAHWSLHDRLVGILRSQIQELAASRLPLTVLEIGAGAGGYTEPTLAAGCRVTAVEMSRASINRLRLKYTTNPGFHAVYDPDGSLDMIRDQFALVLCVSVLHHIPDYLGFLDKATRLLLPGGALLSLQDPMWYPRVGRRIHGLDRLGYFTWRLSQGNYRRGFLSVIRRKRGGYDERNPSDMVEYHVVRDGLDEEAMVEAMKERFKRVDMLPYWSNQLSAMQWAGDRLRVHNTFGVRATGYSLLASKKLR